MAKRKSTPSKRPIEQYSHKDKDRVNNPEVGLVTPETDKDIGKKKYKYDPHLDPQLQWAGKAERLSFDVDTVSLHVHERIDPRSIMEAVRKKNGSNYEQESLFQEEVPLRDAIEFYKHRHNWSNRLIAGDSLLVMNSLIEKEGLAGQVQMIYFDPPYGIKYGSNFQPFVNKRDVKDGKDEDLSSEPETIKAFRDTWELGIHSYLSYMRDRLLLARELLSESGSIFVQISDENLHHVREIMDEVFGIENFVSIISFTSTSGIPGLTLSRAGDYLIWFCKYKDKIKYRQLYFEKSDDVKHYNLLLEKDGTRRNLTDEEKANPKLIPAGGKLCTSQSLTSQGATKTESTVKLNGKEFSPGSGQHWKTTVEGINTLFEKDRILFTGNTIRYLRFKEDFPVSPYNNNWTDTVIGSQEKIYVVQTSDKNIERCLLMTTDPGDLVLDITCGSGTSAFVAEQWGRRWITCDTSRVALTLAKHRLMTAVYDYYELAHPNEGVGSGFKYKTVPHVTLKSIANNEPPAAETLYDQPIQDNKKTRVTGPFTVEAVPSLAVQSIDEVEHKDHKDFEVDESIVRSGETLRQAEWRDELLRTGIRGKSGQYITFSRVEPLPGTRWLHADAETKENDLGSDRVSDKKAKSTSSSERVVISFGPEHSPLEQRQVALAIEEAQTLVPKPKIVVFASFQFDPEAAKDIDETNWPGVTLLKVQMNTDMLTDDLKKKRSSNESFWLIGSPDVQVVSAEWLVDSDNKKIGDYEYIKKLSGLNSLAKINELSTEDLQFYAALSERGDLWIEIADKESGGLNSSKHSGRTGKEFDEGIHTVPGNSKGFAGRMRDINNVIEKFELRKRGSFRDFIERLRGNKQIIERTEEVSPVESGQGLVDSGQGSADSKNKKNTLHSLLSTINLSAVHSPLTTVNLYQVEVLGFDYFNTKTGNIESGGKDRIAMWMLDTDYDGRSLFPRQVFFPMAGEKEGWSKLAKNLKAEIDEELIEAYKGTVSLPFPSGEYKRIAVKIVDDRGIESLKVIGV